jgi:hypothetical protein
MHIMGDVGASALAYLLGLISAFGSQVTSADGAVVLICVVLLLLVRIALPRLARWGQGKAIGAIRGYVENLFDNYARRFTVRGFRYETCRYSLWLAFALWLHAFVILSVWPTWVGLGIIILSALAVALTMSVLGYRTRGPQGTVGRFGIFYEPSFALVSTLLMGKLSDLANRVLTKVIAVLRSGSTISDGAVGGSAA